ncbi:MAG: hypothetical protein SGI73_16220 [Chloroflexota bacterium]|nr:hypothetical protein [Chloroflexota bacterium]
MQSITLMAPTRADRTLTLDLPAHAPTGELEIVIRARPTAARIETPNAELTRDEARRRLQVAKLRHDAAERARLRHGLDGQPPISQQIIAEREDRVSAAYEETPKSWTH